LTKLGTFAEILLLYTTLATRCLGDEGKRVYGILEKDDIALARKELSYLVSRDTASLDENQIIRGTLETISENSVDGVIAPMFYAFLGSFISVGGVSLALPLAMTYKAVNTLDSMVGYKNERYMDFGMCSAKFDDLLNFIPARLAGVFFIPVAGMFLRMDYKSAWRIFFRDRMNHSSPNSGNPESAFAGALGIQFGGITSYFGEIFEKPTIGDKVRDLTREDIKRCCNLLYGSSAVALLFFLGIAYLIGGRN
ncbi:MAG: adenosylcobinamide-phosphate synthase CbiB, partial [Fusobacteriaceae bacterium]